MGIPWLKPPWPKGTSGNPGGRIKAKRYPSDALKELNDTPGQTAEKVIEAFRKARGEKFCGADIKAIQAFKRDLAQSGHGVTSFDSTTDRIEGKVEQATTGKDLVINLTIMDRDTQLEMIRRGERPMLEARVVKDDE
jgi:hypothetical protein